MFTLAAQAMRLQTALRYLLMFLSRSFLPLLIICYFLPLSAWSQGAYSGRDYFEGTIEYRFYVGGKAGEILKELNPIDFMNFHISEGNYIVHLYGRAVSNPMQISKPFATTRVFLADSNQMFLVDPPNSRYFADDGYQANDDMPPPAIPTGDSMLILNQMCAEYRVEKENDTIIYYVSDQVRANLAYFPDSTKARANFLTYGLQGRIPLMTIRRNPERTLKIKATNVHRRELEKVQFLIPKPFKRVEKDYRRW